jgi:hypothetical protein
MAKRDDQSTMPTETEQPEARTAPDESTGPLEASKPKAKIPRFARYFSSKAGHLVTRYGSGGGIVAPSYIGARRVTGNMPDRFPPRDVGGGKQVTDRDWRGVGGVVYDHDEVVAITEQEAARYAKEYGEAVRDGALVERTHEDFVAYMEGQIARAKDADAATKKARDAELAAAEKRADAEKRSAAASATPIVDRPAEGSSETPGTMPSSMVTNPPQTGRRR